MLVATLEDLTGSVEVVVFPKVYEQTAPAWSDDSIVLVSGRLDRRDEAPQILCEAVWSWEDATRMGVEAFGVERDRALARGEREHPVDALEQSEAARLRLVAERLTELRHVAAQLRDEPRELGQLARDLARQDQRLAVGDEVRQRGDERLVREECLRV